MARAKRCSPAGARALLPKEPRPPRLGRRRCPPSPPRRHRSPASEWASTGMPVGPSPSLPLPVPQPPRGVEAAVSRRIPVPRFTSRLSRPPRRRNVPGLPPLFPQATRWVSGYSRATSCAWLPQRRCAPHPRSRTAPHAPRIASNRLLPVCGADAASPALLRLAGRCTLPPPTARRCPLRPPTTIVCRRPPSPPRRLPPSSSCRLLTRSISPITNCSRSRPVHARA